MCTTPARAASLLASIAPIPWSRDRAPLLDRLALPPQEPLELAVLRARLGAAARDLRVDRVLHVRVREPDGNSPLRRSRRRADGHLVGDALRLGRGDPVAALAGHARDPRRGAAALPRDAPSAHHRDGDDRDLLGRRHARVGTHLLRDAARLRASAAGRDRDPGDRAQPRRPRSPPRLDVHPLPQRERLREPPRVPGLARDRPARPADALAGLGRADRVGALALLGHDRDPGGGARRQRVARRSGCASASGSSTSSLAPSRCATSSGWRAAARPSR